MTFVGTTQPKKARAFYCDVLGLRFEEENRYAVIVSAANATLRIQKVQAFAPDPFTVLGWKVGDIRASVQELMIRGVRFEFYQGIPQDDLGIWHAPDGAMVSWFKDPDGNVLSLTQFA